MSLHAAARQAGAAALGAILAAISPDAKPTAGTTPAPPPGQPPSPDGMIFGVPVKTAAIVGALILGVMLLAKKG